MEVITFNPTKLYIDYKHPPTEGQDGSHPFIRRPSIFYRNALQLFIVKAALNKQGPLTDDMINNVTKYYECVSKRDMGWLGCKDENFNNSENNAYVAKINALEALFELRSFSNNEASMYYSLVDTAFDVYKSFKNFQIMWANIWRGVGFGNTVEIFKTYGGTANPESTLALANCVYKGLKALRADALEYHEYFNSILEQTIAEENPEFPKVQTKMMLQQTLDNLSYVEKYLLADLEFFYEGYKDTSKKDLSQDDLASVEKGTVSASGGATKEWNYLTGNPMKPLLNLTVANNLLLRLPNDFDLMDGFFNKDNTSEDLNGGLRMVYRQCLEDAGIYQSTSKTYSVPVIPEIMQFYASSLVSGDADEEEESAAGGGGEGGEESAGGGEGGEESAAGGGGEEEEEPVAGGGVDYNTLYDTKYNPLGMELKGSIGPLELEKPADGNNEWIELVKVMTDALNSYPTLNPESYRGQLYNELLKIFNQIGEIIDLNVKILNEFYHKLHNPNFDCTSNDVTLFGFADSAVDKLHPYKFIGGGVNEKLDAVDLYNIVHLQNVDDDGSLKSDMDSYDRQIKALYENLTDKIDTIPADVGNALENDKEIKLINFQSIPQPDNISDAKSMVIEIMKKLSGVKFEEFLFYSFKLLTLQKAKTDVSDVSEECTAFFDSHKQPIKNYFSDFLNKLYQLSYLKEMCSRNGYLRITVKNARNNTQLRCCLYRAICFTRTLTGIPEGEHGYNHPISRGAGGVMGTTKEVCLVDDWITWLRGSLHCTDTETPWVAALCDIYKKLKGVLNNDGKTISVTKEQHLTADQLVKSKDVDVKGGLQVGLMAQKLINIKNTTLVAEETKGAAVGGAPKPEKYDLKTLMQKLIPKIAGGKTAEGLRKYILLALELYHAIAPTRIYLWKANAAANLARFITEGVEKCTPAPKVDASPHSAPSSPLKGGGIQVQQTPLFLPGGSATAAHSGGGSSVLSTPAVMVTPGIAPPAPEKSPKDIEYERGKAALTDSNNGAEIIASLTLPEAREKLLNEVKRRSQNLTSTIKLMHGDSEYPQFQMDQDYKNQRQLNIIRDLLEIWDYLVNQVKHCKDTAFVPSQELTKLVASKSLNEEHPNIVAFLNFKGRVAEKLCKVANTLEDAPSESTKSVFEKAANYVSAPYDSSAHGVDFNEALNILGDLDSLIIMASQETIVQELIKLIRDFLQGKSTAKVSEHLKVFREKYGVSHKKLVENLERKEHIVQLVCDMVELVKAMPEKHIDAERLEDLLKKSNAYIQSDSEQKDYLELEEEFKLLKKSIQESLAAPAPIQAAPAPIQTAPAPIQGPIQTAPAPIQAAPAPIQGPIQTAPAPIQAAPAPIQGPIQAAPAPIQAAPEGGGGDPSEDDDGGGGGGPPDDGNEPDDGGGGGKKKKSSALQEFAVLPRMLTKRRTVISPPRKMRRDSKLMRTLAPAPPGVKLRLRPPPKDFRTFPVPGSGGIAFDMGNKIAPILPNLESPPELPTGEPSIYDMIDPELNRRRNWPNWKK